MVGQYLKRCLFFYILHEYFVKFCIFFKQYLLRTLCFPDVFEIASVDCIATTNFYFSYFVITLSTCLFIALITVCHRLMPYLVERCTSVENAPEASRNWRSLLIKILAMFMTVFCTFFF